MNVCIENIMSKKCRNILENVCFSKIFTNFAFPKLRRSSPNQLMLKDLGNLGKIIKVIQQCYNQRKQSLEGSRKTA